jgi:hypothetical protein
MDKIELVPETRKLLDAIRHSNKVLSIFEMPTDLAKVPEW